jgi:hypothetical protein
MCGWEIEFSTSIHSLDLMSSDSTRLCVLTQNGQLHFFQLTNCDEGEKSCRPDIKIICKEGGRFQPIWDYTASLDLPDYVELYHFRLLNASTIAASSMNKLVVLNISDSIITIKYVFHYSLKGKSFNCVFILQRFDNGRL